MSEIHFQDADGLQTLVSDEFGGWSEAVTVDQELINDFADLTGDHQWIHVDEERCAKESPFGTTIAHGFLTLTLMPKMSGGGQDFLGKISGWSNILNYGSNKLRFTGAVPVNSEIHQRSRLKSVEVQEHKTTLTLETNIHVVGQDERPAVVYELMMVLM
jgi:acyl dehydratase